MHKLTAFHHPDLPIQLEGELILTDHGIQIKFKLDDPNFEVKHGFDRFDKKYGFKRSHELWKDTCFEAFWASPRTKYYWEFNFSTQGGWNLYRFDDYRMPQPPKECDEYTFENAEIKNNELVINLKSKLHSSFYEYSLCSVIKTKKNESYYFSTSHKTTRPDFHLRESLNVVARKY